MYSIIVVPPPTTGDERGNTRFRLAPGERLTFGRSATDNDLEIPHEGVSRAAGEITTQGAFWSVNNAAGVPPKYRDYAGRVAHYLKEYTPPGKK